MSAKPNSPSSSHQLIGPVYPFSILDFGLIPSADSSHPGQLSLPVASLDGSTARDQRRMLNDLGGDTRRWPTTGQRWQPLRTHETACNTTLSWRFDPAPAVGMTLPKVPEMP